MNNYVSEYHSCVVLSMNESTRRVPTKNITALLHG